MWPTQDETRCDHVMCLGQTSWIFQKNSCNRETLESLNKCKRWTTDFCCSFLCSPTHSEDTVYTAHWSLPQTQLWKLKSSRDSLECGKQGVFSACLFLSCCCIQLQTVTATEAWLWFLLLFVWFCIFTSSDGMCDIILLQMQLLTLLENTSSLAAESRRKQ